MAGKHCNGTATDQPYVRESKAYCEGRAAATAGALVGTNPHPATSRDGVLWIAGFDSYAGGVGSALPQDCCADPAYDGVP